MTEKQLQAKIVMEFSQRYPEKRGLLFAINNEANSNKHAMALKALGVFRGVSDLIYYNSGKLIGIELKVPEKWHSRSHIINQYEWGCLINKNGGEYYIVNNIKSFFSIIEGNIDDRVYTLDKIKKLISESQSRIIFN